MSNKKPEKVKITQSDALDLLSWEDWINMLLPEDNKILMYDTIKKFMSYKHRVSQGVLNAVLIKAILTVKRVHGEYQVMNEAYLRKTFESFVFSETKTDNGKKVIEIKTSQQAINKLTKDIDMLKDMGKVKRVSETPEWLDVYIQELKNKEAAEEKVHEEYIRQQRAVEAKA